MSEWREYLLNDIVEITSSKRIFYSEYTVSGIPFYRSKEIINLFNRESISTELFISKERFDDIKAKYGIPLQDDLLLTSVGTLGIPYLVRQDDEFYFKDGNLTWFRNFKLDLIHPKFLYLWLISPIGKEKLNGISIGSTQPALTIKGLKSIVISLPPLPEQKAIADVLSALDDKIDLLHRQNHTLEQMAETLFRQWFVEEAQEDWEEVELKNFVTLNKLNITKSYLKSEILYLDTGSLTNGKISELQLYKIDEAPSRAKRLVVENDILISTVRPNQKHFGLIHEPQDNLVVSTGFCVVTTEKISPYFIYLLLTNDDMTEYLHSIAEGSTSTYPSLKPEDIGKIKFNLPPKNKIEEFHSIADAFWKKIHKNSKQIQTLETLRDTLLPKLISGEVRVAFQTA